MTNATNVYAVTMMIVDTNHQLRSSEELRSVLENADGPADCGQTVVSIESRQVEWCDDHPLNKRGTWRAEFMRLFNTPLESSEPPQQPTAPDRLALEHALAVAEQERNDFRAKADAAMHDMILYRGKADYYVTEVVRLQNLAHEAVKCLRKAAKGTSKRTLAAYAAKIRGEISDGTYPETRAQLKAKGHT